MGKHDRLRDKILSGGADGNIEFSALCQVLIRLGFDARVKGGHHIFTRDGIDEIINVQPQGNQAKPYQVKQIRAILVKYRLGAHDLDQI
jgi:hypothetical protein